MKRLAALVLVAAGLAAAAGCRGSTARDRYDNRRALASTLRQPASGSEDDRTYRNARFAEGVLGEVRLLDARIVAAEEDDPTYQDFLRALEADVASATASALLESERFTQVLAKGDAPAAPGAGGGRFVCSVEVLAHVTADMQTVRLDPVFRDGRPKIIVVYTVGREPEGDVAFKYTSVMFSHWEYGPWAMEDLRLKAVETAAAFRDAMREE